MAYFDKLNYTLSNEDTRIEFDLLKPNAASVFTIAGSGARVLPLVARNPKNITVVDLSLEQLYLTELRIAAAKKLSYEEYLFFLGYRGALVVGNETGDDRLEIFNGLDLSPDCQRFWLEHTDQWRPHGFILLGKWESHFQKLGKIFRNVLRMKVSPIFEAQSLEEQQELYKKHWNPVLFKSFLRLVASEFVFNKFLYKGHFSGQGDRRTESRPPYQFLDEEFRRLFTTSLVRKNYFMQILFLGRIYFEEGLPLEAQRHTLDLVKKAYTQVNYRQGDLAELLRSEPYDFISLSDTISYLPEEHAHQVLQNLHPSTVSGSQMVIRSFLRAPRAIDEKGWKSDTQANKWAQALDGTGVYNFHIYKKH